MRKNLVLNSSKRGFTLIELLAVIVILAILVLIATPAITNIMQSSAKSNFKNEVVSMVDNMQTAFTEKMAKSVTAVSGDTVTSSTDIYNVTTGGKGYAYLCMTLQDLVDEQYMQKNLGDTYDGYIQMWVPDFSGETITFVNVTNGRYFLQGRMSVISDSGFAASQTASSSITKPGKTTDGKKAGVCPTSAKIPAESVINTQEA